MSAIKQLPYVIPYDPDFLGDGFSIPMPSLSEEVRARALRGGRPFDYIHYSLVMDAERQTALFTATNLDGASKVQIARKKLGADWLVDPRIGYDQQVSDEGYGDNTAFDRGHLVRREDVQWGTYEEARDAARSTFFYSNAALQHMNFNQDEWLELEDYALDFAVKHAYRLCIFAGPVLSDDDMTYGDVPQHLKYRRPRTARGTLVPTQFWKVIVLRQEAAGGDDLAALAFLMDQTELWEDKAAGSIDLRPFQIPLIELESLTGIHFGKLRQVDELSHRALTRRGEPSRIRVEGPDSLVVPGASRRLGRVLGRALRTRSHEQLPSALSVRAVGQASACECGASDADGVAARMSRVEEQVTRLAESLQALTAMAAAPTRTAGVMSARAMSAETTSDAETLAGTAEESSGIVPLEAAGASVWAGLESGIADDDARARFRRVAEFVHSRPTESDAPEVVARKIRVGMSRIVGGQPVGWKDYPSCVCVGDEIELFCTGVLVGPRTVLTAAHCAVDRFGSVRLPSRVMVGASRIGEPGAMFVRVRRGAVHEQYLASRLTAVPDGDLCVLELERELDPELYPFVPIASEPDVRASDRVELVGYGNSNAAGNAGFGVLRAVASPMFAPASADALADALGFTPRTEFIAGARGLKKDTCRGDSGGPAYVRVMGDEGLHAQLAGLTSRMTAEATEVCGDGGVYTMVAPYVAWIESRGFAIGARRRSAA